jgi:tetratricopeptide (TPR) repeat protein
MVLGKEQLLFISHRNPRKSNRFNIGDKGTQALINTGYGALLINAGDLKKSLKLLHQGLSLWRELENRKEEAPVLAEIAVLYYFIGDDEAGVEYAKEGYALAELLDDPGIELYCMLPVCQGLVDLKKSSEARPMAMKTLKLAEGLENLYAIAWAHHNLGDCSLMEGKYHEAEREYGRGLVTSIKYGDTSNSCVEMLAIAMSVAGQGRYAKALRINAATTCIAKSCGFLPPEEYLLVFWHELVMEHIIGNREKLGEELTQKYEEEGQSMGFENAVDYALDFDKD